MKTAIYYNVAEHRFCVRGDDAYLSLMTNYEPFACADGEALFTLDIDSDDAPVYTEELRQEDHEQMIVCGHNAAGLVVQKLAKKLGANFWSSFLLPGSFSINPKV